MDRDLILTITVREWREVAGGRAYLERHIVEQVACKASTLQQTYAALHQVYGDALNDMMECFVTDRDGKDMADEISNHKTFFAFGAQGAAYDE